MKTIIVHGSYGGPEENWFPWLKAMLEKKGVEVAVPRFPTPMGQSLAGWTRVMKKYSSWFGPDLTLVGHSLAPAFIFRLLERTNTKINSAFLVAGFIEKLGDPHFDIVNSSFVEDSFNWDKIKSSANRFFVYGSNNDPYVPIEQSKKIAKNLGVNLRLVKGAGHFNTETFPQLLEDLTFFTP